MIASVHMCDSSVVKNLTRLAPKPTQVDGLRWCRKALCAEPSPGPRPSVQLGRGGILAWWDDDAALDRFLVAGNLEEQFVSDGGFFGFQPYAMTGSLSGKNPTPTNLVA